jgi:hypothetical protein
MEEPPNMVFMYILDAETGLIPWKAISQSFLILRCSLPRNPGFGMGEAVHLSEGQLLYMKAGIL